MIEILIYIHQADEYFARDRTVASKADGLSGHSWLLAANSKQKSYWGTRVRERERERKRAYSNWTEGWYRKREILILNHSGGVWELNTAHSLLTRHSNTQLMLLVFLLPMNSHCISTLWQLVLWNLQTNKASWIQLYWAESTWERIRITEVEKNYCLNVFLTFSLLNSISSFSLCVSAISLHQEQSTGQKG